MYKSILLSIDLGHESSWKKSLPTAVEMARAFSAELHVMTVCPDFGMPVVGISFPQDFEKKALEGVSAALHEFVEKHIPAELHAKTHVGHGTIHSEIVRAADKLGCDLIVLASHRPEIRDYLLGPNAATVARQTRQSVFIVRE